jgi:hypothetical protein
MKLLTIENVYLRNDEAAIGVAASLTIKNSSNVFSLARGGKDSYFFDLIQNKKSNDGFWSRN